MNIVNNHWYIYKIKHQLKWVALLIYISVTGKLPIQSWIYAETRGWASTATPLTLSLSAFWVWPAMCLFICLNQSCLLRFYSLRSDRYGCREWTGMLDDPYRSTAFWSISSHWECMLCRIREFEMGFRRSNLYIPLPETNVQAPWELFPALNLNLDLIWFQLLIARWGGSAEDNRLLWYPEAVSSTHII